jgi:DNA-binding XRE family transcriptional regulator
MTSAEFRNARQSLGLTQAAWGFSLGISREQVAKIEGGKHPVTPTLAILIGLILDNHKKVSTARE